MDDIGKEMGGEEINNLRASIYEGDRFALSKAITLCESNLPEKRKMALNILSAYVERDKVLRIGITGSPGAGKSSFIESLGKYLVDEGHKLAILTIDPSSQKTKGSILGDKTRMASLAKNENVYIRPTASSNVLGGLSKSTKETMALCEMAGYDIIIIESVGVGQSEVDIGNLVDITLLLQMPGGGDEIQGIKRGIIELADMIIINKADGERKQIAELSRKDFARAMALIHHELPGWKQKVVTYSSIYTEPAEKQKIKHIIDSFVEQSKESGFFYRRRQEQNNQWIEKQFINHLVEAAFKNPRVQAIRNEVYGSEDENAFVKLRKLIVALD